MVAPSTQSQQQRFQQHRRHRAVYIHVSNLLSSTYHIDRKQLEKEFLRVNAERENPAPEFDNLRLGSVPVELDTEASQIRSQPPSNGFNLCCLVGKVKVVVDARRVDGSPFRLAEVEVGDETGTVILRARDEQVDIIQEVSERSGGIVLRNCTLERFQGHTRLAITKWGKISAYPDQVASTPLPPRKMNQERNFSLIDLNLFASKIVKFPTKDLHARRDNSSLVLQLNGDVKTPNSMKCHQLQAQHNGFSIGERNDAPGSHGVTYHASHQDAQQMLSQQQFEMQQCQMQQFEMQQFEMQQFEMQQCQMQQLEMQQFEMQQFEMQQCQMQQFEMQQYQMQQCQMQQMEMQQYQMQQICYDQQNWHYPIENSPQILQPHTFVAGSGFSVPVQQAPNVPSQQFIMSLPQQQQPLDLGYSGMPCLQQAQQQSRQQQQPPVRPDDENGEGTKEGDDSNLEENHEVSVSEDDQAMPINKEHDDDNDLNEDDEEVIPPTDNDNDVDNELSPENIHNDQIDPLDADSKTISTADSTASNPECEPCDLS